MTWDARPSSEDHGGMPLSESFYDQALRALNGERPAPTHYYAPEARYPDSQSRRNSLRNSQRSSRNAQAPAPNMYSVEASSTAYVNDPYHTNASQAELLAPEAQAAGVPAYSVHAQYAYSNDGTYAQEGMLTHDGAYAAQAGTYPDGTQNGEQAWQYGASQETLAETQHYGVSEEGAAPQYPAAWTYDQGRMQSKHLSGSTAHSDEQVQSWQSHETIVGGDEEKQGQNPGYYQPPYALEWPAEQGVDVTQAPYYPPPPEEQGAEAFAPHQAYDDYAAASDQPSAQAAATTHAEGTTHAAANSQSAAPPDEKKQGYDVLDAEKTVEAVPNTQHFGPAPPRGWQQRRHLTRRNIPLTYGNLILNCPIPTKLSTFVNRLDDEEFTHMRYSAVTCDPDDFVRNHFTLRQEINNRHTEIFIGITMYNEDETLFCRTLHGVMKNIAHLCTRQKSRMWGSEGWTKVVVGIIADGRKNIHPRVLDCLSAIGIYQEGVAKNMVDDKEVQAHVYEYTTQLSIDSHRQFKGAEKGLVPTQILFCLKEKNAKKINSHRWFFNAFSQVLRPNVCILLDVGTRPEHKSIYHLWKSFDNNSNVAGACGEICVDTGGLGLALLNPLVAAQNFEYKMSNILDKTLESVFGYITVLPGAFSAYRYIALQNDETTGRGPLASYFKGESLHGADADVFTSNMYLAEDRILCFELAAKAHEGWVMKYVRSARGVTDVPDRLPEFISQRRRWLNGAFFSAVYALTHSFQYAKSSHSFLRKIVLGFATFYSFVNMLFNWFGLANFYIFFRVLTQGLEGKAFGVPKIGILNEILHYVYIGTLVSCFILALGNRPQGSPWKYRTVVVIFALLTLYMLVAGILCVFRMFGNGDHSGMFSRTVVSLVATYGLYVVGSLLALDPLHLITSSVQYFLFTPTFINVLNIYAFCNLHDISWGTKGDATPNSDLGKVTSTGKGMAEVSLPTAQSDIDTTYEEALSNLRERPFMVKGANKESEATRKLDYYKNIRTNVLLLWALSNGLLVAVVLNSGTSSSFDPRQDEVRTRIYVLVVLVFVAVMSGIRFIGSTLYVILRLLKC